MIESDAPAQSDAAKASGMRVDGSRLKRRMAFGLAVIMGITAASVFGWRSHSGPEIPTVILDGVEPAVARAIESASEHVRQAPNAAETWGRLGMTLMAHDLFDPARTCFNQAGSRDATNAMWPYLESRCITRSETDLQLNLLNRAAALAGNRPEPLLRLGDICLENRRISEAEAYYTRVMTSHVDHPQAEFGLARIAFEREEYASCLTRLRSLLEKQPQMRPPWDLTIQAFFRSGDSKSARAVSAAMEHKVLMDSWPDSYAGEVLKFAVSEQSMLFRVSHLMKSKRFHEAESLAMALLRIHPASSRGQQLLGRCLLALDRPKEAESPMREAVSLAPEDAAAQADLGRVLKVIGRLDEATDCFRHSLRLNPDDPSVHFSLAECYIESGSSGAAVESLKRGLRLKPESWQHHLQLGRLLVEQGDKQEGLRHLQDAIKLAPDSSEVRQAIEQIENPGFDVSGNPQ